MKAERGGRGQAAALHVCDRRLCSHLRACACVHVHTRTYMGLCVDARVCQGQGEGLAN